MLSILKMSFRISFLLSCSAFLTTQVFAAPFASNDSASRAMGGTGVASSQTYASSYFNPSLLAAYGGDKGFGLMLPATVSFDDSSRLLQASRDYFESSYDIFSNYDVSTISTLISGEGDSSIIGSFDAVATASAAVATKLAEPRGPQDPVDIDTEIAGLIAANDNLQVNMALMNEEIIQARVVVSDANAGLLQLSDRPLHASAGFSLAIAIPSQKWGTSLFAHTDLLMGLKVDLSGDDTQILLDVIDDFQAMVEIASDVSTELSQVVVDTAELSNILVNPPESASWDAADWLAVVGTQAETDALQELADYAQALTDQAAIVDTQVSTAQTESERLENYDGNYISGGELTITEDNRPELVSSISVVGANIAETGVSFARRFNIGGEDINVGITPKFQRLDMFDHTYVVEQLIDGTELDAIQTDLVGYIQEHYTTTSTVNLDIGLSKDFTYKGNIRAGLVIKNLIAQTFETEGGSKITIPTQVRMGLSHTTKLTTFAFDLDLTKNAPLSFGESSQFLGLGAELNLFGHAKIRAGYRNNLAVQNGASVSAGLAFTPFGIGVDAAAWFKPTADVFEAVQDIGVSIQLSSQF